MVNVEVTNEAYMSGALPMPRITTTLEEQQAARDALLKTVRGGAPVVVLVVATTAVSGPVGLTLAGAFLVDSSVKTGIEHYDLQLEKDPHSASLSESVLGVGVGRSTGLAEVVELATEENLDTGELLTNLEAAERTGKLGGIVVLMVAAEGTSRVAGQVKVAIKSDSPSASSRASVPEPGSDGVVDSVTGKELLTWQEFLHKYRGQGQASSAKSQSLPFWIYKMTGRRAPASGELTSRVLVDPSVLSDGAAALEYARIYRESQSIYLPSDPTGVGTAVTGSEIVVWIGEALKRGQKDAPNDG
jgi:hypothetical protein